MKVEVQNFKKSINETNFTDEQIKMIWDFYVTKSVASSASQKRTISDYGKKQFPWKEMLKVANISNENVKILFADTIDKTLANKDLITSEKKGKSTVNKAIEIDVCKIVCVRRYTIADEDEPTPTNGVGKVECVLTHIRNAFAHGNTYFFDNGNVLLEDRTSGSTGKITARIIIHKQTLLDWISLIDKDHRFYILRNVSDNYGNTNI